MTYERRNVIISAMIGAILAGLIITGTALTGLPGLQTTSPPTVPPTTATTAITTSPPTTTSTPEIPPPVTTLPPLTEGSGTGTLVLMLTDAPPSTLKYLYIKVDEVRLHLKGNRTGEGSVLNFPVTPTPRILNVTKLKDAPATLGISPVPAGNYTAIWLHIVDANATFAENPGVNVTLKVVAQGWLKIQTRFEVSPGGIYGVVLDFDMAQTHVSAGNVLTPVVRPKQVLSPPP